MVFSKIHIKAKIGLFMQYAVLAQTVVNGPNGGYEMKAACLKIYETIYNMIFIQIWYSSQNQAY